MIDTIDAVLSTDERHEHMAAALERGFPFLEKRQLHRRKAIIVCYGPSLAENWQRILVLKKICERPIIAVSGAYKFLVLRGIVPDYYVAIDPRESAVELLGEPQEKTKYLMASVCHPEWWDLLRHFDVRLWHLINGPETLDWIRENDPKHLDLAIGGGSTVGQRAMNVARIALGYRRFDVFGMDCSFTDTSRHAGFHNAERHPETYFQLGSLQFKTSPQFWQAANEMVEFLKTQDVEVTLHGEGLLQAVMKKIRGEKK